MWGSYPQDIVAFGSILMARFEMMSIDQVRWKKKPTFKDPIGLTKVWNPSLSKYCRISNSTLKEFCIKLYALVYEDAVFPFDYLFRDQLISPDVNIMIQTSN